MRSVGWLFVAVFFALGCPLAYGWWQGQFVIFWTDAGAALVQVWGCAIVLAVFLILTGIEERRRERRGGGW